MWVFYLGFLVVLWSYLDALDHLPCALGNLHPRIRFQAFCRCVFVEDCIINVFVRVFSVILRLGTPCQEGCQFDPQFFLHYIWSLGDLKDYLAIARLWAIQILESSALPRAWSPNKTSQSTLLVATSSNYWSSGFFWGEKVTINFLESIPSWERSHIPPKWHFESMIFPTSHFGGICIRSLEGTSFSLQR